MADEEQNKCDLSNVILQMNANNQRQNEEHQRTIKRVLHFSDGDLVEYVDDDDDDDEADAPRTESRRVVLDPKTLQWIPWTWHQTIWFSSKLLEGCDYVGEALADFFGITSPKYQFEIDEYHRQQRILAEERKKEQLEMAGWSVQQDSNVINTSQPATKL